MQTLDTEFTKNSRVNKALNFLFIIVEFAMLLSILIFCFFIIKGYLILGHIPVYGDKEIISYNGFDRTITRIMLYPMFYGIYAWILLTICGLLLSFKRKRKSVIIGLILCVLNLAAMFSSQFIWILD